MNSSMSPFTVPLVVSSYFVELVWRKEADGQWRVAQEQLNVEPTAGK
jgi:ketosteroid isomerase-like protein